MPWSLIGVTTGSASASLSVPAGTQDGDLLIHVIGQAGTTAPTPPSGAGWALIATTSEGFNQGLSTSWKVWRTGDPTSVASSAATNSPKALLCYRHDGDTTPDYDVHTTGTDSFGSPTVSSVTTSEDDALLIFGVARTVGSSASSPPSGWTEDVDHAVQQFTSGVAVSRTTQAVAGATGTVTGTLGSGGWVAHLAAFVPVGEGGGGPEVLDTTGTAGGTAASGADTALETVTSGTASGTSASSAATSVEMRVPTSAASTGTSTAHAATATRLALPTSAASAGTSTAQADTAHDANVTAASAGTSTASAALASTGTVTAAGASAGTSTATAETTVTATSGGAAAGTATATTNTTIVLASTGAAAGLASSAAASVMILSLTADTAGAGTTAIAARLRLVAAMGAAGTSLAVLRPESGPTARFGGVLVTVGTDRVGVVVLAGTDSVATLTATGTDPLAVNATPGSDPVGVSVTQGEL